MTFPLQILHAEIAIQESILLVFQSGFTLTCCLFLIGRANSSGTNGNPLFVGSLTPVQELPALSSSSSLRTLLEGRT